MANKKFKLVYFGEIAEGHEITSVKKNIGQLFKIDEAKVEQFFTAESVTIKKDMDYESAIKFKAVFEKTGGKCTIVPMDYVPPETSAEIRTNVKAEPSEPVEGAKSTFRKDESVVIEEDLKQQETIKESHIIEQSNDDNMMYPAHLGIKKTLPTKAYFAKSKHVILILLVIAVVVFCLKLGNYMLLDIRNNKLKEAARPAGHDNIRNAATLRDVFVYEMPNNIMENTIYKQDKLTISKNVSLYQRDDIVAYRIKDNTTQIAIGRIIGVPGEEIKIVDKIIYINNNIYPDQYGINRDKNIIPAATGPRDNCGPKTMGNNDFFILGDNRDWSYDSRFMRPITREELVGKVIKIVAIKSDKPSL